MGMDKKKVQELLLKKMRDDGGQLTIQIDPNNLRTLEQLNELVDAGKIEFLVHKNGIYTYGLKTPNARGLTLSSGDPEKPPLNRALKSS
jgi:hypothetical protein